MILVGMIPTARLSSTHSIRHAPAPDYVSPAAVSCRSKADRILSIELAPAAFDHDISVMAVLPAGSNPYSMRTRRRFPSAGLPGIGVAIPTVVSAYPDMLWTWA